METRPNHNQHPWSLPNTHWEKGNGAIFSIQSVDRQKIALDAHELAAFAKNNPGLQGIGCGHSAFAMASALNLPIGVLRSEGDRGEFRAKVSSCIRNNGLLVITGHSLAGGKHISGLYVDEDEIADYEVRREPRVIVDAVMEAKTLFPHDHITILLCVCHGSLARNGEKSFAEKLALEFAKREINTTIIASSKQVQRFGLGAIQISRIAFNEIIGMANKDISIFTTTVEVGNIKTNIYKPNKNLVLTSSGLIFASPHETFQDIVEKAASLKAVFDEMSGELIKVCDYYKSENFKYSNRHFSQDQFLCEKIISGEMIKFIELIKIEAEMDVNFAFLLLNQFIKKFHASLKTKPEKLNAYIETFHYGEMLVSEDHILRGYIWYQCVAQQIQKYFHEALYFPEDRLNLVNAIKLLYPSGWDKFECEGPIAKKRKCNG